MALSYKPHGLRRINGVPNPEYANWQGIKQRCYNPKHTAYPRYGGRGIQMCDRWRESFADFLIDIGPRPTPQHTLDRINNDGNYEPSNVRWATPTEQARNSRRAKLTLEKAHLIRSMYAEEDWSYKTLAVHFGVQFTTIQAIINNKIWKV